MPAKNPRVNVVLEPPLYEKVKFPSGDLERLRSGAILVVMAISSIPISGLALIGSICTFFIPFPGLGRR